MSELIIFGYLALIYGLPILGGIFLFTELLTAAKTYDRKAARRAGREL